MARQLPGGRLGGVVTVVKDVGVLVGVLVTVTVLDSRNGCGRALRARR